MKLSYILNIIKRIVIKSKLNTSVQLPSTAPCAKPMLHNIPQRWVSLSVMGMKYFLDEEKDLFSVLPSKYETYERFTCGSNI